MAITGNQAAITPARSGVLRSGAGRSGWPISVGRKVLLYALSNIARSDATRSNYHSGRTFVSLGGIWAGVAGAGRRVLIDSLTLTDVLNHEPNTASFRVQGSAPPPPIGQDIVITLGSTHTLERVFAGQVLATGLTHVTSDRRNTVADVRAIDWAWGLNQRLVTHRWQTVSATTIAQEIVALGAPGYTTDYVAAGLPVLDEFTVTDLETSTALTALSKRLGGYWYVDYHKAVHLFTGDDPYPATPPTILNAVHPTLRDLQIDRDGSQLVTRVYVEGGGSVGTVELPPGQTMLPLATASWYLPAGGVVKSGPQRLRYTGVSLGGGGTLVGPGASPAAAPAGTIVGGAGMTAGAHDWAVSFVTANGESLAGPRLTLSVGAITAPPTAATIGGMQAGSGPDVGGHYWAVSFLTASGETTIGPAVWAAVQAGPIPAGPPTPVATTTGGSIEPGSYAYACTYVTATGESTPGPLSGYATLVPMPIAWPSTAPVPGTPTGGGSIEPGTFAWSCTFVTALGESRGGPNGPSATTSAVGPLNAVPLTNIPKGPAGTIRRRLYRKQSSGPEPRFVADINDNTTTTYTDTSPTTLLGGPPPPIGQDPYSTVIPLIDIPRGTAGVLRRRLYRTKAGGTAKFLTELANNTATTFTDTLATASLGGPPPTINAAGASQVLLHNLPLGGPDILARRVYRTKADTFEPYQLAVQVTDNTTTSIVDAVTDAGLGAAALEVSTALANRVQLAGIPIGASGVTSRKLYRTAANVAALQLLTTLGDNATTDYLDAIADAALGAAPSASDTSGLPQPSGNVPAGATSIIVAGAGAFLPTGGWAVIGNGQQVVRYAGIGGNAIIGIPTAGPGAIVASIAYNSTITASPMLTGIPAAGDGAIVYPLKKGDDVNLWLQVDDPDAQALAALLFSSAAAGVHSGILEDVIQDRRLSAVEARARGQAHLAQRRDLAIRVRYRSRDLNTRSGRLITIYLPADPYNLSATFMIQSVTMHDFLPGVAPVCDVEASSTRSSFEDLLRRISLTVDVKEG